MDMQTPGPRPCVSVYSDIYSVSSVVGVPGMWCLDVIGRDVWDRVGRKSISSSSLPPPKGGVEALAEFFRRRCTGVIVVVVVVVVDVPGQEV